MTQELKIIKINSFNCRGLRDRKKRLEVFNWLKESHLGITLLQETHSAISDEQQWEKEWGGDIYFSHGEFNARGVATLIPSSLMQDFEYISGTQDQEGRVLQITCKIDGTQLTIFNIYSPTKDNPNAQLTLVNKLKGLIEKVSSENVLIGGDLNTYLDINKDKEGGKIEQQSEYSKQWLDICEEYSLVDVWRIRNPNERLYTRRENSKCGLVQSRLDYWLVSIGITYQIKTTAIMLTKGIRNKIIQIADFPATLHIK